MIKKMFSILVIIGMVFFIQCTDEPIEILDDAAVLKAGNGGGNGGGGNGGGGNGGQGGLYGDLIICLRTPDGIPIYEMIDGEHGTTPYPLPIMIDESTLEPLKVDDVYQVFDLNSEGEVIPEPGYIVEEVEFGRLNIVRAPQSVVDQALQEAKTALEQSGVTSIQTDASGRLIAIIGEEDWLVNYDDDLTNDEYNDKTIDSPRENVAIYQELMSRRLGQELSFLELKGYSDDDVLTLAFGAIAAGADKTGTMNVDEFAYMNNWLLRWESPDIPKLGPDEKDRFYYDYSGFSYDRLATYGNKYVRIALLFPDGTWHYEYQSLYNVVSWTSPNLLIDYANLANTGITGFSNAADDAIQVLEYIHESDLIEYSPYFTAGGFVNPN